MFKKRNHFHIFFLFFVLMPVLLVSFNNCSQGMFAPPTVDLSSFSKNGGIVLSGACGDQVVQLYEQTYHPFLTKTCGGCHTNGPGIGQFGSQDTMTSFNSFMSMGRIKIHRQALDPAHKQPATGPQNSPTIDPFIPYWEQLETKCSIANVGSGLYIETTAKSDATVSANTNINNKWTTLSWDLSGVDLKDQKLASVFSMTATIDVRTYIQNNVASGYQFRNPSFKLKSTGAPVHEVKGIAISINNKQLMDLSTYQFVDVIVNSTTAINSAAGYSFPLAALPVANTDKFSLGFSQIIVNGITYTGTTSSSGTTTQPPPVTPTPVPTVVTFTNLTSTDLTLGVFKNNCVGCHNSSSAAAGLDLTNYAASKAKASLIQSRMNNATSPMPTSGLLPQSQRDIVNNWITNGMPQ